MAPCRRIAAWGCAAARSRKRHAGKHPPPIMAHGRQPGKRDAAKAHADDQSSRAMYGRFAASLAASFVAMYLLAFSQIDVLDHFHLSLSVLWISLAMVSAMGLIMLVAMRGMLPNRRLNVTLVTSFALLLLVAFAGSRTEALVGDDAFLRSMIPHHSRAIHMCQEARLNDPEVLELCDQIVEAQREEIAIMEGIMERRE